MFELTIENGQVRKMDFADCRQTIKKFVSNGWRIVGDTPTALYLQHAETLTMATIEIV